MRGPSPALRNTGDQARKSCCPALRPRRQSAGVRRTRPISNQAEAKLGGEIRRAGWRGQPSRPSGRMRTGCRQRCDRAPTPFASPTTTWPPPDCAGLDVDSDRRARWQGCVEARTVAGAGKARCCFRVPRPRHVRKASSPPLRWKAVNRTDPSAPQPVQWRQPGESTHHRGRHAVGRPRSSPTTR